MVTILRGISDPDLMTRLPRFLAVTMLGVAMWKLGDKAIDGGPSLKTLIPTVHYDFQLASEIAAGSLDRFRALAVPTLLLGGTRSRSFLAAALDALESVLPHAQRFVVRGAGHLAPDNSEQPEHIAAELSTFFADA
jgi:pimeloyl-ACP methyl ester carboxylesterase